MSGCNYNLLQDMYTDFGADLEAIASKIEELDLSLKIDELDIDLDAITAQLEINNKLRLLELVGTDIMTEEDQKSAYNEIKHELFPNADDVFGISGPTFDNTEESEF